MDIESSTIDNDLQTYPGKQLFLETFQEIEFGRIEKIDNNTLLPRYSLENSFQRADNVYRRLFYDYEGFEIPRLGICSEVLFYHSCRQNSIDIIPSSLIENHNSPFDFYVKGIPIDVTTSSDIHTFSSKWEYGRFPTLYIPISNIEVSNPYEYSRIFPLTTLYAYKLLYNNEFDNQEFLERTYNINKKIYHDLLNTYNIDKYFNYNGYGLITKTFLNNLNEAISKIDIATP
jgi:hypothetical protein